MTFSAPPNKQVAVYLKRTVHSEQGKAPTFDVVASALKQEYGANPVMFQPTVLAWFFNESSGPLVPAPQKGQPFCPNSQTWSPNHSISTYTANTMPLEQPELTHWLKTKCGMGITVVAKLTVSGGLVMGTNVTMMENAEDLRDALAGELYIEKANKAAKQQQMNDAQGQKVPKL